MEPNYCVLSYKEINCGESLDAKQDWKRGGGGEFLTRRLQVFSLISLGKYNFNLEETSSVEVVKVSCHHLGSDQYKLVLIE